MLTVDNVLEWLEDIYEVPCTHEYHGVNAFRVMQSNYPAFCEEHCDYEVDKVECWKKYLEAVL